MTWKKPKVIKWKDNLQFSFDIRNTLINAIEKVGGDIRCTDESNFIFVIDNRDVHIAISSAKDYRMTDKEEKEMSKPCWKRKKEFSKIN